MFWPMRNSSFCSLSSTLPWIPSSTPTGTRRWAPPSDRSSAASAVRTPAAPPKAQTVQLLPSTTPSWPEFTAMTTPWFRKQKKMRNGPSSYWGMKRPPATQMLGRGVGCERQRTSRLMYFNTNRWQYLFLNPARLDTCWKLAYVTALVWIPIPFESRTWRSCNRIRKQTLECPFR